MWLVPPRRSEDRAKRTVYAFVHIFKAAGTSVQVQLREALGEEAAPQINDGRKDGLTFLDRVGNAIADPRCRIICGHAKYVRFVDIFRHLDIGKPHGLTFLRDPIKRLVSAYNYTRSAEYEQYHQQALTMEPEDYFRFLLSADPESVSNHQCLYLGDRNDAKFETARDSLLSNFDFFGVSDNIEAINPFLAENFGISIDPARRENVSPPGVAVSDLNSGCLSLLMDATAQDRRLYEFVKEYDANRGRAG